MSTGDQSTPSSEQPKSDSATSESATELPAVKDASEAMDGAASQTVGASSSPAASSNVARGSGPLAARGLGIAKPASPSVSTEQLEAAETAKPNKKKKQAPRPRLAGEKQTDASSAVPPQTMQRPKPNKVAVPSVRAKLSDDIQAELDAAMEATDLDALMRDGGGMPDRKEPLEDGARIHARF